MTKALSLKMCCSWFLSTCVLLGLLALTLWIKGEASTDVFIKALFLPLQLSIFRHSTYRWWVKLLLVLALIPLVSLVLHLMNWSWQINLTQSHLLVLCPLFLILAGLIQLVLTTTDRTYPHLSPSSLVCSAISQKQKELLCHQPSTTSPN